MTTDFKFDKEGDEFTLQLKINLAEGNTNSEVAIKLFKALHLLMEVSVLQKLDSVKTTIGEKLDIMSDLFSYLEKLKSISEIKQNINQE